MEGRNVNSILLFVAMLVGADTAEPSMVIVVGAAGAPEYGQQFGQWAARWVSAAERAGAGYLQIGHGPDTSAPDRERLQNAVAAQTEPTATPLWLILIGHGTFDGQLAKFNLRGPDVSATELADWLKPLDRPVVVVNCASSSAPFINRLSAPNRVVITATKSGFELNYTRLGDHLSAAIADADADLDKDGQTSLLEAFLLASARLAEFYEQESRLQTETALIDDNGDGRGTPASWFRGIHVTRQAKDTGASPDGARAHQLHLVASKTERAMPTELRLRRDQLELQIVELRQAKGNTLNEEQYYDALQSVMIELAHLYQQAGALKPAETPRPSP
jgi:hypothetical protein